MNIGIIPSVKEYYKNQLEFSFETNLVSFLNKTFKKSNLIILNDLNNKTRIDLLIITGGNDLYKYNKNLANKVRNKNDEYYFKLCRKKNTPILGICYGAQFIADKFNSKIIKKKHIGNHKVKFNNDLNNILVEVNSYHNFAIKKLGTNLNPVATSFDKTVECFLHKKEKILGIMWHPERNKKNSVFDKELIINLLCN